MTTKCFWYPWLISVLISFVRIDFGQLASTLAGDFFFLVFDSLYLFLFKGGRRVESAWTEGSTDPKLIPNYLIAIIIIFLANKMNNKNYN